MIITEQRIEETKQALTRLGLSITDFENETSENIKDIRRKNIALEAFFIFCAFSNTSEIYDRCVEYAEMISATQKEVERMIQENESN